jgi:putative DNA primase/helicase
MTDTAVAIDEVLVSLKKLKQWVLWRYEERDGKKTKVPYQFTGYKAQSNNPNTWSSYEQVVKAASKYDGIGIMFANGLCGIDLDHHSDTQNDYIDLFGHPTADAEFWISCIPTYWEVSPSGQGLHALAIGKIPAGRRQDDKQGAAFYDTGRFFTVTGKHIEGTPQDVLPCEEELASMYKWLFGEQAAKQSPDYTSPTHWDAPDQSLDLKIVALILGDKKYAAVWRGDLSAYQGDQSRADLAMAGFILRATSRNTAWADRVIRAWPCFRPEKWDMKHFSSGDTYGQHTLVLAAQGKELPDAILKEIEQGKPKEKEQLPIPVNFMRTDADNGARFAFRHGQTMKYHKALDWLAWDGRYWKTDETGEVMRRARDTARAIFSEAEYAADDETASNISKWATASLSNSKLQAMISQAESMPEIGVTPDKFNRNLFLLNCANGTLDLKTGSLLKHEPNNLISKISEVSFDPDAECPMWLSFLDRVMSGNADMLAFLQRAVGYSLTGEIGEQCLFLNYGTGANGKSVFNETILSLLGDYAQAAEFTTFLSKAQDGIRNDIARLAGARFVSAIEAGEGRQLSEVLVKSLTGGDAVTSRFLHKEYFTFRPQFKMWLATNHKPVIKGTDYAIWRRIRLIPFTVTIPEPDRDMHLIEKLRGELPGILNWAVQGCLDWQANGLGMPSEVRQATQDYRDDMDALATFIKDCCVLSPTARATSTNLHTSYCAYSGEQVTAKEFKAMMTEHGYRIDHTRNGSTWMGIGLLDLFNKD